MGLAMDAVVNAQHLAATRRTWTVTTVFRAGIPSRQMRHTCMMQLCLVAVLARRWNALSARACWVFLATVCHLTAWLSEPLQCCVLLVVCLELIHVYSSSITVPGLV